MRRFFCSDEVAREFALRRLHLTPETRGRSAEDVSRIVSDIGGLQHGGHLVELYNRIEGFETEWFNHQMRIHSLIDGHVLRRALRIVPVEEYPLYFWATRSIARKKAASYSCPSALDDSHRRILALIEEHGPISPAAFRDLCAERYPNLRSSCTRLFYELYNYGRVARLCWRKGKPLFDLVERLPFDLNMEGVSEDEARRWLFLKCLSIYGPFSAYDIAHWVGWTISETRGILDDLKESKEVVEVGVEGRRRPQYIRAVDEDFLGSLIDNLPEYDFIRILLNDDALLLGYYKRLESSFQHPWRYPQFSEGKVWQPAILHGRELAGEMGLDLRVKTPKVKVLELILRKDRADDVLPLLQGELERFSGFHGKEFEFDCEPRLV